MSVKLVIDKIVSATKKILLFSRPEYLMVACFLSVAIFYIFDHIGLRAFWSDEANVANTINNSFIGLWRWAVIDGHPLFYLYFLKAWSAVFNNSETALRSFSRSCIEGIIKVIDGGAQYVIQMDADLSHHPQYLPLMLNALGENELVVGSRYVSEGKIVNWDLRRRLISRIGNCAARMATNLSCYDMTNGFCGWQSNLLKKIPLDNLRTNGYAFLVEIKYLASLSGGKITEMPITFTERRKGRSKMNNKIIIESILFLLSVVIKRCLPKIIKK